MLNLMNRHEYNSGWETRWDDMKIHGPFSRHLRRILLSLLDSLSYSTLLDVGCGQGSLLADIRENNPQSKLSGLDFSSDAIKLAKQKVPNGDFYELNITESYVKRKYDVVICSEVLEHIKNDEAAIQHLYRMTENFIIISSPQGRMRKFEISEYGHVRSYSKGELINKLKRNGFTPIKVIEWGFPFYSPIYRNLLEITGARGTSGKFGIERRIISRLIYMLFLLNSSNRGDEIVVLAQPE